MENIFTKITFENDFTVDCLITLFYMEFSKEFRYGGERHDFWEMVYIDKGKMLCTANGNRFVVNSGEVTFHKPNEFHNLEGNGVDSPNVSIITFECKNPAMEYFNGKIFKLNAEEKHLLAMLFSEGLSCYEMENPNNPLIQKMSIKPDAPFGSSQATKNLLELFLIKLSRVSFLATKSERQEFTIDGVRVPQPVKNIVDYMKENIYGRITIKDIAEHIHQSETQAKKIFSRYYGTGLIHYYNALKIKEARRLIRDSGLNMSQIAESLHFDNPQYFTKCFKRFVNMTPSEYRKSILEH